MPPQTFEIHSIGDKVVGDAVGLMTQSSDRLAPDLVMRSYVDMGHFDRLRTQTPQYVEGRRGTGKTHLLTFFTEKINCSLQEYRQAAIFIDARELLGETPTENPSPQIYAQKTLKELLLRIVNKLRVIGQRYLFHNDIPVHRTPMDNRRMSESYDALLELQRTIISGKIVPSERKERTTKDEASRGRKLGLKLGCESSADAAWEEYGSSASSETFEYELKMDYAAIREGIERYLDINDLRFTYIIIGEWSSIPANAQPHLAEYIKRCLFPSRKICIKIGIIPLQTRFHTTHRGQHVGFERNGDIFRALNLDDDLVYYGERRDYLKNSFITLLNNHIAYNAEAALNSPDLIGDEDEYRTVNPTTIPSFLSDAALERLLLFSMGNPRDFLNLFRRSFFGRSLPGKQIHVPNIESAAKQLGIEKLETVKSHNPNALQLFQRVSRVVFYEKKTNAFLIREAAAKDANFLTLIHHRALHIWDRSYSSPNHAGERFIVISLDYCIIVEHLKSPNYRTIWQSNESSIVQLRLFPEQESGDEPPSIQERWRNDEVVRVLQAPDKRTARYVVLPDRLIEIDGQGSCEGCGKAFRVSHAVVKKFGACPHCGCNLPEQQHRDAKLGSKTGPHEE